MDEELIRAACEAANCKYPDMETMADFKREVTPSAVIGLLDGLRHAKGIAAINDARANGAAETIQHLRAENSTLRAQLPSQGGEAVMWVNPNVIGADMKINWPTAITFSNRGPCHNWTLPLYTHPADQVAGPDAELVELLREVIGSISYEQHYGLFGRIKAKLAELQK